MAFTGAGPLGALQWAGPSFTRTRECPGVLLGRPTAFGGSAPARSRTTTGCRNSSSARSSPRIRERARTSRRATCPSVGGLRPDAAIAGPIPSCEVELGAARKDAIQSELVRLSGPVDGESGGGHVPGREPEPMVRRQRLPRGSGSCTRDPASRSDRGARCRRLVHCPVELSEGPVRAAARGARRPRGAAVELGSRPPLLPGAPVPRP